MPTESAAQRLLPQLRRVVLARAADAPDGQLLGEFVTSRDEAAFAALVRRHGPMVLGVCRRVTGDPHLADDAFQAAFLVLARRAAAVRPRHLVGPWLYGVAYRTALKARGAAARRKAREKQVDAMPHPAVPAAETWADLQPVLDAELARLPDKLRVPVLLCDLNGRPQRDVARELKVAPATLARRLAAARKVLARRLTDRGVVLSPAAVAAALGWHAATSAVPPALAAATVSAACAAAAGTVAGLPAPVVQLSEGVMRMFVLQKVKAAVAGAASGLVLLAGLGLLAGPTLRANPEEKPATPPPVRADPKPPEPPAAPKPESEDAKFFRRLSLDLRGVPPTALEMHYFLEDKDPKKRAKVTDWMLPEHGRQKVSTNCQSCHKGGHAFGDFDKDGWPDMFVAQSNGDILARFFDVTKAAGLDVDAAKADVERARAALAAAAEAVKKAKDQPDKDAKLAAARLEEAQARQALAHAELRAAEKQLVQATERQKEKEVLQQKGHADRVARDIDQLIRAQWYKALGKGEPTDAEFLRRVLLDATGLPPTTVEMRYFLEDKDPKKREKLLQWVLGAARPETARDKMVAELLADPEVQKRWAELWQRRVYEEQMRGAMEAWLKAPSDPLERLLSDMLAGKKSDEQMLEAVCLATLARFPTDPERKLILDGVKGRSDRAAAWREVVKALAATEEAQAHAAGLAKRAK